MSKPRLQDLPECYQRQAVKTKALRIAIAKAHGWRIETDEFFAFIRSPDGIRGNCCGKHFSENELWELHCDPHPEKTLLLPDYPNDLNAMHEAEKMLNLTQQHAYGELLAQMVRMPENASFGEKLDRKFPFNGWGYFELSSMTSAERAEAFLRTIGKWEDDE